MHARTIRPHNQKQLPNIFGLTWLISVAQYIRLYNNESISPIRLNLLIVVNVPAENHSCIL
jgi:hypothetical protein